MDELDKIFMSLLETDAEENDAGLKIQKFIATNKDTIKPDKIISALGSKQFKQKANLAWNLNVLQLYFKCTPQDQAFIQPIMDVLLGRLNLFEEALFQMNERFYDPYLQYFQHQGKVKIKQNNDFVYQSLDTFLSETLKNPWQDKLNLLSTWQKSQHKELLKPVISNYLLINIGRMLKLAVKKAETDLRPLRVLLHNLEVLNITQKANVSNAILSLPPKLLHDTTIFTTRNNKKYFVNAGFIAALNEEQTSSNADDFSAEFLPGYRARTNNSPQVIIDYSDELTTVDLQEGQEDREEDLEITDAVFVENIGEENTRAAATSNDVDNYLNKNMCRIN